MAVLTKSQQVEKTLRECLTEGRWAVGERMPSEDGLMSEFGVSRTTLRDALNTLAYDGLVIRKHGSGTFVAQIPAAGSIALVALADGFSAPHWFQKILLEELSRRIQDSGYRAILSIGQGMEPEDIISSMCLFDKSFRSEVVGVFGDIGDPIVLDRLEREKLPLVLLGYGKPMGPYSVVLDYARQTELAVLMLKAYGYDDFALMHVAFPESTSEIDGQSAQPLTDLCRAAVNYDESRLLPVAKSTNYESVHEVFRQWWARPDRPNAIYFYDDALCDAAVRDILDMGISVPDDLAIITLANVGTDFHFPMPITGLEFDPVQVADAAWDILYRLIKGHPVDQPVVRIAPSIRKGRSLGESVTFGG